MHPLRHALRLLLKDRAFTVLGLVTLSLATALVITMFSVVNGIYLKGLPLEGADRLMHLERDNLDRGLKGLSVTRQDFADWKEQNRTFAALSAYRPSMSFALSAEDRDSISVTGAFVTPDFHECLQVKPRLGRPFSSADAEPGAFPVVILGYDLWNAWLGGDPDCVGQTIFLNGEAHRVVGIMDYGFAFPTREQVWVPLVIQRGTPGRQRWGDLQVVGRLREGIDLAAARDDLDGVARALEEDYPEENAGIRPVIKPFLFEYSGGQTQQTVALMCGAVIFILVIACANVSNLLMVRAARRGHELAIRSALGAGRASLFRQVLTEGLVIAFLGSLIGLLFATWCLDLVWWIVQKTHPPFWYDFRIDGRVVLFVFGISLLSGLATGVLPAWQACRPDVHTMLKEIPQASTGRPTGILSSGLVIGQIALSCSLLIAAGLTVRTLFFLESRDMPFAEAGVHVSAIDLNEKTYNSSRKRIEFYDTLLSTLGRHGEISSVALAGKAPGESASYTYFTIEGRDTGEGRDFSFARIDIVSSDYFSTLEVKPHSGRIFSPRDREGDFDKVVVNTSFVRRHLPGPNPVGRRIKIHSGEPGWANNPWLEIIGVVPDLFMNGLAADGGTPAGLYVLHYQIPPARSRILLREHGEAGPAALKGRLHDTLESIDPALPAFPIESLEDIRHSQTFPFRVLGLVFSLFATVALVLASIGIYGVMAFHVRLRTREIGIRMALGADRFEVMNTVLRRGIWQAALGLGLGILLAALISETLRGAVFQVAPNDPVTYFTVVLILAAVTVLASFVPARQAARVEPLQALRDP